MNYPIFNSIVNFIETELQKKNIKIIQFKTWNEEIINATGLEITIDLEDVSPYLKKTVINLDWDKFRELNLAKTLSGLEKHPLLQSTDEIESVVKPNIDVEVMWYFNEDAVLDYVPSLIGNVRIEAASKWMEEINQNLHKLNLSDNLITRWHVEIEGDMKGKFLSDMCLISYLQYELGGQDNLNDIHEVVEKKIQELLMRTNRVIQIATNTLPAVAA